ncbi:MAG: hypothetical protein KF836_05640 [Fimbriimonadaceae bacterium]|nr:hypothetical protein [Fimbriimonadaceae bacterium]
MRLKTITTGLLIFGVLLLLGLIPLFGMNPGTDASFEAKRVYAIQFGAYSMVIFAVAIAVIICAMIVLRRTSNDLKEQAKLNMQIFVEGSLNDHKKKTEAEAEQAEGEDVHDS